MFINNKPVSIDFVIGVKILEQEISQTLDHWNKPLQVMESCSEAFGGLPGKET